MTTITIWLLVSIGYFGTVSTPSTVVERFVTVEECQRVKTVIESSRSNQSPMRCIQATVARP